MQPLAATIDTKDRALVTIGGSAVILPHLRSLRRECLNPSQDFRARIRMQQRAVLCRRDVAHGNLPDAVAKGRCPDLLIVA
jgi:hypothetical protein